MRGGRLARPCSGHEAVARLWAASTLMLVGVATTMNASVVATSSQMLMGFAMRGSLLSRGSEHGGICNQHDSHGPRGSLARVGTGVLRGPEEAVKSSYASSIRKEPLARRHRAEGHFGSTHCGAGGDCQHRAGSQLRRAL